MKKIIFLMLALIVGISTITFGKVSSEALNYNYTCNWNSWFEYPNKYSIPVTEDVYVRVKAQYTHHIYYMELYVDGNYIRKENNAPYEWCKGSSGDDYLRHLTPGYHTLKVKIKDKCGQYHYLKKEIKITGGIVPDFCQFNNPLYELQWLKNLKQQHSNWKIDEYRKNGKVYFKLYQCGITHFSIYWYDCTGKFICQHLNTQAPNGSIYGAQYIKCWWNPCNGGGNGGNYNCNWQSWFQYPQSGQHFYNPSKVYVRVNPQKKDDIKYMELYINNNYIRKESHYPFEWCTGNGNSDYKLRNLPKGTYTLKVKIVDNCGNHHYETCVFYVH